MKKDPTFLRQDLFQRDSMGKLTLNAVGHPVLHRVWRDWFADVVVSQVLADELSTLRAFDLSPTAPQDHETRLFEPSIARFQENSSELAQHMSLGAQRQESDYDLLSSLPQGSLLQELGLSGLNLAYTEGLLGNLKQDIEDVRLLTVMNINPTLFVSANALIVAATKTKITYDIHGLVTAGADATTADIADSLNKRYVTDANLVVIGNTSGTNSGDNATNTQYSGLAASKADVGQTFYLGTTQIAINRASANLALTGITGITPTVDFTLTQNAVIPFTSVEVGATVNTLYLKTGYVGIGNVAPSTSLDIQGILTTRSAVADSPLAPTESLRMSLTGYATTTDYRNSIFNSVSGGIYGTLQFRLANGIDTQLTVLTLLSTGNVGIGTVFPFAKLSITGTSAAADDHGIFQVTTGTGLNTDNKLTMGVVDGNYSWIQAVKPGTSVYKLSLNPSGGNVGVNTIPDFQFEVKGNTANFYSITNPVTNATARQITIGEHTNNADYRLALGYFFKDGVFKGAIQCTGGGTGGILVLNGDLGAVGIGTDTPVAQLAINGGLHVGGDSDPGDNNLLVDGTGTITGAIQSTSTISAATGATGGFRSSTYSAGQNLIWAFGNAPTYGFSYQQAGGTDDIRFHFGNYAAPQFMVDANGRAGVGLASLTETFTVHKSQHTFTKLVINNPDTTTSDFLTQASIEMRVGGNTIGGFKSTAKNLTGLSTPALLCTTEGAYPIAFSVNGSAAPTVSIHAGLSIGGSVVDTDPGDGNILTSGSATVGGAFGCNSKTAQTAYASAGALAGYGTGAFGLDSDANMTAMYNLVVAMRAALVANGIMS